MRTNESNVWEESYGYEKKNRQALSVFLNKIIATNIKDKHIEIHWCTRQ